MKFLKRILYLISPFILLLLSGCQSDKNIKIGIMQIVEHESLDSAREGFIDELKNLGYENAEFDLQIAGGDLSNCQQFAEKFANDKKDLILAISTPCAQAAANSTKDIPIVATAITNFEDAGIVKSNTRPGVNVTGTSDLAPVDKIIQLAVDLKPNIEKIGVLYSNIDPSPQYQAQLAEEKIRDMKLEPRLFAVSQTNEVKQVAEKLAAEVDALYVPIDKITAATMPEISRIFLQQGKFVVCAENTMIEKGAIGTYAVDYHELGKMAARQAEKILKGEDKPQDMPIEYFKDTKLCLNYDIIKKLGLEAPDKA